MNEITKEVVIVLCKCGKVHKTFGIRAEKNAKDSWQFTWAFPIKETSARREGYDKTAVRGIIAFTSEYPGCPYCGGRHLTVCSCGHLNCTVAESEFLNCEWCGRQGRITDYTGEEISAGMDL